MEFQKGDSEFLRLLAEGRTALGNLDFDVARECFMSASLLDPVSYLPDFLKAQSYLLSGMYFSALDCLLDALDKSPNEVHIQQAFVDCIRRMTHFFSGIITPRLESVLLNAHCWLWVNPQDIFQLTAYVVKQKIVQNEFPTDLKLMEKLLEKHLLTDVELEIWVRKMRCKVLSQVFSNIALTAQEQSLAAAIAIQTFRNEYLWPITKEEEKQIESTLAVARLKFDAGEWNDQALDLIQTCAMFFPISSPGFFLEWIQLNQERPLPPMMQKLIAISIDEPSCELTLKGLLKQLTSVHSETSKLVGQHYESYPYPKWMGMSRPNPVGFNSWRAQEFSWLPIQQAEPDNPSILVAGCGTGRHALQVALRYNDAHVTAIDLSKTSLAFAQRKANEMGISNVTFYQGDILELSSISSQYDLIECIGTLHHLQNPMKGWDILVKCLKPAALMKVGLYSRMARTPVRALKQSITLAENTSGDTGVREFRERIFAMRGQPDVDTILGLTETYSLSPFRDLFFHPQEHQFDLLEISDCLKQLELDFIQFDISPSLQHAFQLQYGMETESTILEQWHRFEQQNPATFIGMYQFWCSNHSRI